VKLTRRPLTAINPDSNHLHVRIIRKKVHRENAPDSGVERRCNYFASRCRARGVRVTAQRLAIFQALARDASHPTADSLYSALRKTMPSISLSTIYRILESLESEGLIRRVSTTCGSARYDGNLAPHQHLVCRVCGRMTDFTHESFSRFHLPGANYAGLLAEGLDIRIVGTCLECRSHPGSMQHPNEKQPGVAMSPM
jgi:Fur family transcriptional regulator, peroxide stress response regulator